MNKQSDKTVQRVLVTGASRGIGRATALQLGRDGFPVTVHYNNNADSAREVAEAIQAAGGQADTLGFDVSNRQATQEALEQDIENDGAYWGVVCNAGIASDNAFPALTGEQWDSVVNTNLGGFYNVLQTLIMPMIRLRAGGRIVTLASVSGLAGNRGQVNYSAAKAGIIGATKALALEVAKRRITVNCVAPGLIETDMLEGAPVEEALKLVPAGRLGTPDEVASLIGYLFSPPAGYITRQVLSVNGGIYG
ncbi:MAG TPA: 3-oxoacyl-ACP reductase FabG [Gammaproteobacteria bacterium]|nr:3-oxoacyl-ACP reductase FabG [Gammaproteobacteria bacterium]